MKLSKSGLHERQTSTKPKAERKSPTPIARSSPKKPPHSHQHHDAQLPYRKAPNRPGAETMIPGELRRRENAAVPRRQQKTQAHHLKKNQHQKKEVRFWKADVDAVAGADGKRWRRKVMERHKLSSRHEHGDARVSARRRLHGVNLV